MPESIQRHVRPGGEYPVVGRTRACLLKGNSIYLRDRLFGGSDGLETLSHMLFDGLLGRMREATEGEGSGDHEE